MGNNEKKIYLSEFERKVQDGDVAFVVLNAEYDTITSKKGKQMEVVKLRLELSELNGSANDKEFKNINIFVDRNPDGAFHKFVSSALTALQTTAFQPSLLINLKGKAVLSHHKPEGSEYSFPRMNDWIFYKSSEALAEAIASYEKDDDEFDVDFEGDDDIV